MASKNLNTFSSNPLGNTIIGPSILISGRLSGDEDLIVQGRVEGEIALSHTLFVEKSGIIKANVSVKNAIVSGVVVGNIRATECVELTPGGRMVGDIASPRVIIVDGASFRGRVEMGEAEALRATRGSPAAKPASEDAPVALPSSVSPPPLPMYRPAMLGLTPVPRVAVRAPSPSALPEEVEGEASKDKPLPPEPPVLMDVNTKKLVVKKKN